MKKLFFALFCSTLLHHTGWAKKEEKVNLCLSPALIQDLQHNGALSMHIEAMVHEHSSMKQHLGTALDQLRANSDFGEVMLQKIMNLLNAEITIVNHLLCGEHGALLQNALVIRNQMLISSAPSVAYMYDKILDLSTYDQEANRKLFQSGRCGCGLAYALSSRDKKCFLSGMREKLVHYHGMMRQMQCNLAIGSATVEHMLPVDSKGNCISFCPVIR